MKRYNFNFLRQYGVKRWIEETGGEYNNITELVYDYESCTETEEHFTKLTEECHCSYKYLQTSADYVRFFIGFLKFIFSKIYVILRKTSFTPELNLRNLT